MSDKQSEYRKHARITGEARDKAAADVADRYRGGHSIRRIATDMGRSYGFVHGLLVTAEVPLRGRGGPTRTGHRKPKNTEAAAL